MKLYSNKALLFVDHKSGTSHKVPLGFSTAPDWVEKTDLFVDAKKEGSLKLVEGSTFSEGEKKLADAEKKAYEDKIAELEARLASKEIKEEGTKEPMGTEEIPELEKTNEELSSVAKATKKK